MIIFFFLLLKLVQPQPLNFSYPNFSNIDDNELLLSGNASIDVKSSILQLTPNNQSCFGRAMKREGLGFCTDNAMLSFTTEFKFLIKNRADGLAFFIAPSLIPPSNQSSGQWLGLVERSTNGNLSNHLIGIEIDTYQNPELQDLGGDHVGIDVNGLTSLNASLLSSSGIQIGEGRLHAARVDYNASLHQLRVFVSSNVDLNADSFTNMGNPVLEHDINLCAYVKNTSYVGLSAATGAFSGLQSIYSWKFTSELVMIRSNVNTTSLTKIVQQQKNSESSFKIPFFVSVSLGGAALAVALLSTCLLLKRSKEQFLMRGAATGEEELVLLPREIHYPMIALATGNFSQGNLLGSGGFGSVYKGILPGESLAVAVKRVSENSSQGEREFLTEVKIISRLSHRNLVKLRGWCKKKHELMLVYEFMPQGSLDRVIFKNTALLLLWSSRYKIICGLASAILYLHEEWEQQVIHRDIKCSNVMLDGEFNARLGDFGLARVLERDKTSRTTNLAGTLGYIAPEIGFTYKFTSASDVYSFGVVALEVVSGRQVVSQEVLLLPWIEEHYEAGTLLNVVDPRLHQVFDREEVMRVLQTALRCVSNDPKSRPSMRQVLHSLTGKS